MILRKENFVPQKLPMAKSLERQHSPFILEILPSLLKN
jgi:hypothetical protein